MKSERRHDLEKNELANVLASSLEKHRDKLPRIAFFALGIFAGIIALSMWAESSSNSQVEAWTSLRLASHAKDASGIQKNLREVIKAYEGTPIALWAKLDLADLRFIRGLEKRATDPDAAELDINDAREDFQKVYNDPDATTAMKSRALLAWAKCLEIIGDRDKAIEKYEELAASADGLFAEEAAQQAKALESGEAAEFYAWLESYTPPATGSSSPSLAPDFLSPGTPGPAATPPLILPDEPVAPATPEDPEDPKKPEQPTQENPDEQPSAQPAEPPENNKPSEPTKPETKPEKQPEQSPAEPSGEPASEPPAETPPKKAATETPADPAKPVPPSEPK